MLLASPGHADDGMALALLQRFIVLYEAGDTPDSDVEALQDFL